ncbi:MAG: VanZ family protein [Planctomycetota bacterium]|nr:VanZ family protein [Planctomycetota bacterium]
MRVAAKVIHWWSGLPSVWRWGAVVAEMGALWWLSSREIRGVSASLVRSFLHNSAHVVAYGVLATLALLALRGRAPLRRQDALLAVAIAGSYGVVDELHQSTVEGRVCSVADIAADLAGAMLATGLVLGLVGERMMVRSWVLLAGCVALLAVSAATFLPW